MHLRMSNLMWSTTLAIVLSIAFASSRTSTAGTLDLDNLDWNVQILIDQSQTIFGQSQFTDPRDNRGLAASPGGQFLYAGYNNSFFSGGEVRRIDLSQTGMVDPFDNQLTGFRGKAIGVDDIGRVYLAEGSSSDFIHVYSADLATVLGTIDLGATSKSEGVALAREGGQLMLYTSDRSGGTLQKRVLTESGANITGDSLVGGFGTGGTLTLAAGQDMRGVEVDGSGRVWVAGFGNDTLYRVSADGSTVDSLAVSNAFDIDFDGDSALITRAGDLVLSRIDANTLASLGADLTIPWATLALDADGQSGGGTLSGIAFIPGVGVFVANEAGQTFGEQSTYGAFDGASGGGFADFTHDDNDPILFAAIPEPATFVLAAIGFVGLITVGWRRRKRAFR